MVNAQGSQTPLARRAVKPEKVLALGFLAVIALGGLLLALPAASAIGRSLGVRRALFTATSAVCVTGLTLIDAGTELTGFGQGVLLGLIQVGGLGFMAFATLAMVALGRRVSLHSRMILRDAMNQSAVGGMVRLSLWFALMAFAIETAGACALMPRFIPLYGTGKGIWYSFFHAVSAFCNAGFDLAGGGASLARFSGDPLVLLVLACMIVLGGLGFTVILECLRSRLRFRRLSLHAKLALTMTGALLLAGFAATLALEWHNPATLGGMSVPGKLLNALFQSVTLRTAGFAAIDQAALTDASKLIGSVLMFVGASPASTGGGVKTTTAFVMLLMAASVVRGRESLRVMKREIAVQTARRAMTIVLIGAAVVFLCACALSVIEPSGRFSMLDLYFEAVSAFSTTGLSSAGTGALSPASHWLLMPIMYFGRVGPLTLAFALASRMEKQMAANRTHYPEEKVMIG